VGLHLPYIDTDNNVIVDDTTLLATTLTLWRFDEATGQWVQLPDAMIFPAAKVLVVSTTQLGLFGLFRAADGRMGEVGLGDGGLGRVPVGPVVSVPPGAPWVNIGLVTRPPFLVPWDTTGLAEGEYELRALCANTLARLDQLLAENSGGSGNPGGRSSGSSRGNDSASNCFIATAAFGSPLAPQVEVLRRFRDRYLLPHALGRTAVQVYNTVSPPLADAIRERPALRAAVRMGLTPVVWGVDIAVHGCIELQLGLLLGLVGSVSFTGWQVRQRRRQS
jgi:hypothetical protein